MVSSEQLSSSYQRAIFPFRHIPNDNVLNIGGDMNVQTAKDGNNKFDLDNSLNIIGKNVNIPRK